MQKYLLTNQAIRGNNYAQHYGGREYEAAKRAGFTIIEINASSLFFSGDQPDLDLDGAPTFVRHYANEDGLFSNFVEKSGGKLMVPGYFKANEWYKVVPNDVMTSYWFGGRSVNWMDLSGLDPDGNHQSYMRALTFATQTIFEHSIKGKMFIKAPQKRSLGATLYTKKEFLEAVQWELAMGVHGKLHEIIYAQPMDIAERSVGYKREEYRCLIVGDKVSSVSLYTDKKRKRNYADIEAFANEFAAHFAGRLPVAYCLDLCRLIDTTIAVVEINDICAFGFYADNDINKFFEDVYALA